MCAYNTQCQSWTYSFGAPDTFDVAMDVVELDDPVWDYLIVGTQQGYFDFVDSDVIFLKINVDGEDILIEEQFNRDSLFRYSRVFIEKIEGENYIISARISNGGYVQPRVLKYNLHEGVYFAQDIAGWGTKADIIDLHKIENNRYVAVGRVRQQGHPIINVVGLIDSVGTIIWQKNYDSLAVHIDDLYRLSVLDNDSIVLLINYALHDSLDYSGQTRVCGLDTSGNVSWSFDLECPYPGMEMYCKDVVLTPEGNYLFSCEVDTISIAFFANRDYGFTMLIETDPMGDVNWWKYYYYEPYASDPNQRRQEQPVSIHIENDGNIILLCSDYLRNSEARYLFRKLDPQGEILWEKRYGLFRSWPRKHIATSDGGYLIIGDNAPVFGAYINWDMYFVKTDSEGNVVSTNVPDITVKDLSEFHIWPTLTTGSIYLECNSEATNARFELYSVSGVQVYAQKTGSLSRGDKIHFDVTNIQSGVYVYFIHSDDGTQKTGKLVKVR